MRAIMTISRGSLYWLPLFVMWVCVATSVAADEYFTSKDAQGRRLIDVQVDHYGNFPFLIDTAASHTVLYRRLVDELGLEPIPRRSAAVITATGERPMRLYQVRRFSTLGTVLELERTIAMPDQNGPDTPYGIVGVDLMRGRVLMLGPDGAQLFESAAVFEAAEHEGISWQRVDGRPVGRGSVALNVNIGGHTFPAVVDTGAGATVINRAAADKLRKVQGSEVEFRSTTLSAAGGRMRAENAHVGRVSIGDVNLGSRDILVANLPVFNTYVPRSVPAVILGADILLSQPVAIDFNSWAIYLPRDNDLPEGRSE